MNTKKIIIVDGPNRVGKTTTVNILASYLKSTGAKVKVVNNNVEPIFSSLSEFDGMFGPMFQFSGILNDICYNIQASPDFYIVDESFLKGEAQIYGDMLRNKFELESPVWNIEENEKIIYMKGIVNTATTLLISANKYLREFFTEIEVFPFILGTSDGSPLIFEGVVDSILDEKMSNYRFMHLLYALLPNIVVERLTPHMDTVQTKVLDVDSGVMNTITKILLGIDEPITGSRSVVEWVKKEEYKWNKETALAMFGVKGVV
jgi:hypothetical protein